jgi:hypothetical protein
MLSYGFRTRIGAPFRKAATFSTVSPYNFA